MGRRRRIRLEVEGKRDWHVENGWMVIDKKTGKSGELMGDGCITLVGTWAFCTIGVG